MSSPPSTAARRQTDRGQVSAELMGLIVVVAIVIAALATAGFGGQLSGDIQTSVCRIYGGACSSQSVRHEPETACETLSSSGEASAEVVAFSVNVGATGKYTLSRTVDKDGKEHWYVTLEGHGQAGADFLFGEDAHLGDLGEGGEAEVKALLAGGGGSKYEFSDEKAARDFVTDSEHEVVKQAVLPWYADPFGLGHKIIDKLDGHSFNPPPAKAYFFEGGEQVDGSLGGELGVAKGELSASGSAVVGLKVEPANEDHGIQRTIYSKVSAEGAATLGLFDTVGGEAGADGEVVVGLTYNDKGQAIKASVEAAGTLKAEFGPEMSGPETKLGDFAGKAPKGSLEGAGSIGAGKTGKLAFEIDLTKGNNRNVLADGLHSIGLPVLSGDGSQITPSVTDGVAGVYNLFDTGADGTQLTKTTYDTASNSTDLEAKGGDGLTFGVEGGLTFEDQKISSGSYYSPGSGFVTWEQCGK